MRAANNETRSDEFPRATRTLETADSGSRMPPTDLVGATIFSTSTRSRRGMRRLAILFSVTCARRIVQALPTRPPTRGGARVRCLAATVEDTNFKYG